MRMGKQLDVVSFWRCNLFEANSQLSHTPRTSDRTCVSFLTESGIICHRHRIENAMMSIFSSVTMQ